MSTTRPSSSPGTSALRRSPSHRRPGRIVRLTAALLGAALIVSACGSDGSSDGAESPSGGGGLEGKTIDFVGYGSDNPWGRDSGAELAGRSATSPGMTMTLTQRSAIARRTAISMARGICSVLETSSQ